MPGGYKMLLAYNLVNVRFEMAVLYASDLIAELKNH